MIDRKTEKRNTLCFALRCGMGRVRQNNEDAYFVDGRFSSLQEMDKETALSDVLPLRDALFAVCDGMGGASNGEWASYTAVSLLPQLQQRLKGQCFSDALREWVAQTGPAVAAKGGGCTLALLYVQNDRVRIAHIGDSRVYRFHEGELSRITRDHSKVQILMDVGLLTPEQARTDPRRHVITRYLGMNEEETGFCTATVSNPLPLQNADRYLICSDGVTDMLEDSAIADLFSRNETAEECAEAVYRAALGAGGKDNTTLIVVDIHAPEQISAPDPKPVPDAELLWPDETEDPENGARADAIADDALRIVQKYDLPHAGGGTITVTTEVTRKAGPHDRGGRRVRVKTGIRQTTTNGE